jgi:single-strand DNA-binding protein
MRVSYGPLTGLRAGTSVTAVCHRDQGGKPCSSRPSGDMTAQRRKRAGPPGSAPDDDPASRESTADGVAREDQNTGVAQEGPRVAGAGQPDRNEVALTGRLSAAPTERVLPTGSRLTAFRLIVRRPVTAAPSVIDTPGEDVPKAVRRNTVDVVDCAVWDADLAGALAGVAPGDYLAVRGALRRRFASSGGRPMSWFTVEVAAIERVGDWVSDRPAPGSSFAGRGAVTGSARARRTRGAEAGDPWNVAGEPPH